MAKTFNRSWSTIGQRLPGLLITLGLIVLAMGGLVSYGGFSELHHDNDLRKSGVSVQGRVESVERVVLRSKSGKHGRGSDHIRYEYIPQVRASVDGKDTLIDPRSYATSNENAYKIGQTLTVMYDPADPGRQPGIKDASSRAAILHETHLGIGILVAGSLSVLAGIVLSVRRSLLKRRDRFDREGRTA